MLSYVMLSYAKPCDAALSYAKRCDAM